ncbi:hypothetical protein VPH35_027098 [Triticum aestivum]
MTNPLYSAHSPTQQARAMSTVGVALECMLALTVIKVAIESVEVVLGDAERESIKHKSMLLWLKRLMDADMLEDFEDETDLNLWAATVKKIKMPHNMRSMQKRIEKIKEDREDRQGPDIQDTAGYVEEAEIIWRTDDCIYWSSSYFPLLLTTVVGVSR